MYPPSYYENLEREVVNLVDQLAAVLREDDRHWIEEWLDAGEYDLVIATMLQRLQLTASVAPTGVAEQVRSLALRLGMHGEHEQFLPE